MSTVTFSVTFEIIDCADCGLQFAMTQDFLTRRRQDHQTFHCPRGHRQNYGEKTDIDRAREETNKVQAKLNEQEHLRLVAEKKMKEAEAEAMRLKNRAAHGVCLCCNRTFKDLADHMKTRHPQEIPGHEQKFLGKMPETVYDLELGVRAYNVLVRENITTIDALCEKTEHDLLRMKNMGRRSVDEVVNELFRIGRSLNPGNSDAAPTAALKVGVA